MSHKVKWLFVDNDCQSNLVNGLPHYGAGIITEDFRKDGKSTPSGKDFSVLYIDPWGSVNSEWRSMGEIRIITDADETDFEMLSHAIESLGKLS